MASQPGNFNVQEFADAGVPLVGGRLYTYSYGTTTQKTAYTDAAGLVPQTYTADGLGGQYIALNSRGELPAPLYLASGSYDLALKRADGSTVWTRRADPQASGIDLSNTADYTLGVALVGGAGRVVDSIATLKSLPKAGSPRVFVTGYYAAGDGGGGLYWYDSTDTTSVDNGGTIIVASDGGRWKLVLTGPVTVLQFGAKGDGATDDGTAFNAALTWCGGIGGGIVLVPVKNYFFGTGTALTVPAKVTLKGMAEGPFGGSSTPTGGLWGPTLLVTNLVTTFLTLNGYGAKVMNLLFFYPNQVLPTAATPTVYPATITSPSPYTEQAITGITIINGYIGIQVTSCRTRITDCVLGCFFRDINIDNSVDWVVIDNVLFQVMWDAFITPFVYPSTIDTWVLNNGIAIATARCDSLMVSNCGVFSRYCFHNAADSNLAITPKCGYGRFTNIDCDTVGYGVLASAANTPGFHYTNIDFSANGGVGTKGQWACQTQAGGTVAPVLTFSNGSIRGTWVSGGSFPFSFSAAGQIYTTDIRGMQPAVNAVVAPAVPVSTGAATNTYTFPVLISISGGTITTLNIAGAIINTAASSSFILPAGKAVAIAYTGVPTWTWVGI